MGVYRVEGEEGGWLRFVGEVEVAVARREAACILDVTEEVPYCCRFREEGL